MLLIHPNVRIKFSPIKTRKFQMWLTKQIQSEIIWERVSNVCLEKGCNKTYCFTRVSTARRTFISCIFYNYNCAIWTNFGSPPSCGKKCKKTSFRIFVRECRRHDVYSRLWTLGRVCYYPVDSTEKKLSLERSKPAQWSGVSLMICTSPWKRDLVLIK